MSVKTDQAIAKITEECEGKDYLIPFEEYLTSICTVDNIAEKILAEDKTLTGCCSKMQSIAKKRAVNGFAFIPQEEGYAVIRDYYGITEADKSRTGAGVIDIIDYL